MLTAVIAFCSKDAELQRKNLEWCLELDSGCGREGVLSYDTATSKLHVEQIEALAIKYFTKVNHCLYQEPPVKGWPAACNWAWQSTARWMFEKGPKQPWLWLEADAIPLKSGWLLMLEKAHQDGGRSFGGHVVKDMGHMNGVGIYPWDVMRRNEMAMLARAAAWDVVLKPSTINDCTPLNRLIQHAWNVHPIDRTMIWNGDGTPLTFKSQEDVGLYMDFNAALIHRVKDGSLIPLLRERHRAEQEKQRLIMSAEYNVPQHIQSHDQDRQGNQRDGGVQPSQPAVDGDVPGAHEAGQRLGDNGRSADAGSQVVGNTSAGNEAKIKIFQGKCEIFIVTYGLPTKRQSGVIVSDFDWLAWCLRSIRRWGTGFTGITLAIPGRDAGLLAPISKEHALAKSGIPLRVKMYDEQLGKGHIQHMAIMGCSEQYTPVGTTHVLHVDADVIFRSSFSPSSYITGEKPTYVVRSYESLKEVRDGQKVVSDCYQWKEPTEAQLGFQVDLYTMCCMPMCFPVEFYEPYRQYIERTQKQNFHDYMLSGRNEHPATRMDWTAMGAWAYRFMPERFNWVDISKGNHLAPVEHHKSFWSHAGIQPEIEVKIREMLK